MIVRLKFNKRNYLRYIGHLDLMRLFHRAFNKSGIKVSYSQGFNPQPKFSIASPLSLGIESEEEYMDLELEEKISIEEFIERLNKVLPKDVKILDAKYIKTKESIASIISWAFYEIKFHIDEDLEKETMEKNIQDYFSKEEIFILKRQRKGRRKIEREVNVKGLIGNITVKECKNKSIILETMLKAGGNGNLRPIDLITSIKKETNIDIDLDSVMIKRLELYAEENNNIYKPL